MSSPSSTDVARSMVGDRVELSLVNEIGSDDPMLLSFDVLPADAA